MLAFVFNGAAEPYMRDELEDEEVRQKLWKYWGSFTRSMLTMLEITLGNWVPACRTLMDNVSEWYALIFFIYKLYVDFAMIKIITGVFLHETFKCAANNDELMIQNRDRAKMRFREKMLILFQAA